MASLAISWLSAGFIIVLQGTVTANGYVTILGYHVRPIVQYLYSEGDAVYYDDKALVNKTNFEGARE